MYAILILTHFPWYSSSNHFTEEDNAHTQKLINVGLRFEPSWTPKKLALFTVPHYLKNDAKSKKCPEKAPGALVCVHTQHDTAAPHKDS